MDNQSKNLVKVSIQAPTQFLANNWQRLLPSWQIVPQSIVIILFKSKFSLEQEGELIIQEKNRLLQEFLSQGNLFYTLSQQQGYLSEIVSPKEGTPQYSNRGELTFDLVAIIHESLGLPYSRTKEGCKVLIHPEWGMSIYPGLFICEATPEVVLSII
jgi:hypothetical protein